RRFGPRWLATGGLVSAALGMARLAQITPTASYVTSVLPALMLISIGMGFAFVPLSATALFAVGQHDAGIASAVLGSSQQIGGALGIALLHTSAAPATAAYLLTHPGPIATPDSLVHGFTTAFWFGAGFFAAGALVVAV